MGEIKYSSLRVSCGPSVGMDNFSGYKLICFDPGADRETTTLFSVVVVGLVTRTSSIVESFAERDNGFFFNSACNGLNV